MYQTVQFVKINPAENTTVFVLDPIAKDSHQSVARELMAYGNVSAEQVGFVTLQPSEDCDGRIDMMGGEFCGNASRSLGAYLAYRNGQESLEKIYRISCSGIPSVMECQVKKTAVPNRFIAKIEMPLPRQIRQVSIAVAKHLYQFQRVDFEGITHFVLPVAENELMDRPALFEAVKNHMGQDGYEALGVMFYDLVAKNMVAAVYVKATDSLFWERSCGSGTAAVGAVLGTLYGTSVKVPVRQVGGIITTIVIMEDQVMRHIQIDGEIEITAEGLAHIDTK